MNKQEITMKKLLNSVALLLILSVACLLFARCDYHPEYQAYTHYITHVYIADSVECKSSEGIGLSKDVKMGRDVDYTLRVFSCVFYEKIDRESNGYDPYRGDLVTRPNHARIAFLKSIGDNGYKGRHIQPGGGSALWSPISNISIQCSKAINERYPAGSELSSIFLVTFTDNYSYIKGGYKGQDAGFGHLFANDGESFLKNLAPGPRFLFYIIEAPSAIAGETVEFTLEVTFRNGTVVKDKFAVAMPSLEVIKNPQPLGR